MEGVGGRGGAEDRRECVRRKRPDPPSDRAGWSIHARHPSPQARAAMRVFPSPLRARVLFDRRPVMMRFVVDELTVLFSGPIRWRTTSRRVSSDGAALGEARIRVGAGARMGVTTRSRSRDRASTGLERSEPGRASASAPASSLGKNAAERGKKPTPARTTVRSGKDGAGAARAPETRGRAAFARSDIRAIEKSVPRVTDLVMSGAMRTPRRPGAGAAGAGAEATTAALASDAPSGATETPSEPPSPPTSRSPPLAAPETPAGVRTPRRSARLSNASAQAAARDPGGSPPRPARRTRSLPGTPPSHERLIPTAPRAFLPDAAARATRSAPGGVLSLLVGDSDDEKRGSDAAALSPCGALERDTEAHITQFAESLRALRDLGLSGIRDDARDDFREEQESEQMRTLLEERSRARAMVQRLERDKQMQAEQMRMMEERVIEQELTEEELAATVEELERVKREHARAVESANTLETELQWQLEQREQWSVKLRELESKERRMTDSAEKATRALAEKEAEAEALASRLDAAEAELATLKARALGEALDRVTLDNANEDDAKRTTPKRLPRAGEGGPLPRRNACARAFLFSLFFWAAALVALVAAFVGASPGGNDHSPLFAAVRLRVRAVAPYCVDALKATDAGLARVSRFAAPRTSAPVPESFFARDDDNATAAAKAASASPRGAAGGPGPVEGSAAPAPGSPRPGCGRARRRGSGRRRARGSKTKRRRRGDEGRTRRRRRCGEEKTRRRREEKRRRRETPRRSGKRRRRRRRRSARMRRGRRRRRSRRRPPPRRGTRRAPGLGPRPSPRRRPRGLRTPRRPLGRHGPPPLLRLLARRTRSLPKPPEATRSRLSRSSPPPRRSWRGRRRWRRGGTRGVALAVPTVALG